MTKLTRTLTLLAGALTLSLSALASADTQILDKVIAVVDKGVVLQSEFIARKNAVLERLKGQYDQLPPTKVLDKQILDQLIMEQLQINEAHRYGIEITDKQLNQALKQVMKSNGLTTMDQLASRFASQGMSMAQMRAKIRRDLLISQVQRGVVNNRINITPQEIDNFLSSSDGKYATSPDYHLKHILISAPASSSEAEIKKAKAKVEKLYRQLQNGANFSKLAIANSNDQTALKGGDIGWRKLSQLPELFSNVVSHLKVGQVSKPIRSGAGFHLLKNVAQRGGGKQFVQQTKARHILIKTSEVVDDATAKQKLLKLKKELENGADFAKLARENSEDIGSMLDGGNLGWSSPGQFVPAFENAMEHAKIGEIVGPFKSQFGWHILQVTDRRKQDMSDKVVRNKAAQMLRNRRFDEELQVWQAELRDNAYIDIKEIPGE